MDPANRKTRDSSKLLVEFSPGVSDSEMARALGISRQAVHHHTRRLNLPRRARSHKYKYMCWACSKRLFRPNKTGMCRSCWKESHAYEFICVHCGKLNLVYGKQASIRRANNNVHPNKPDLCGRSCTARYFRNKKENNEN